jgi:hypothetical protein
MVILEVTPFLKAEQERGWNFCSYLDKTKSNGSRVPRWPTFVSKSILIHFPSRSRAAYLPISVLIFWLWDLGYGYRL